MTWTLDAASRSYFLTFSEKTLASGWRPFQSLIFYLFAVKSETARHTSPRRPWRASVHPVVIQTGCLWPQITPAAQAVITLSTSPINISRAPYYIASSQTRCRRHEDTLACFNFPQIPPCFGFNSYYQNFAFVSEESFVKHQQLFIALYCCS